MFKKKLSSALLACALLASPAVSLAEGQPTLAQAVDAAWARAIEAAESAGQARRADAALAAAHSPWAGSPSVELGQRQDRSSQGRGRETDAALVMPLWLPGQRAARIGAAGAESEAAKSALTASRLRVAGLVREAQWNYYAQQAELAAAEAQLRTFSDLARDVDRRVTAGDLARTDALASTAEQLTAQAGVVTAKQKLAAALTQWRTLTGLTQVAPPEPSAAQVPSVVPESHPNLQAARAGTQMAQRRLDAVRSSRRDPPELTIGTRHESPVGGGPDSRGLGVAIRIPFASDSRNQPLLAAALSELELAEARERRAQFELSSELEVAVTALEAASRGVADEERRAALLRERHQLLDRSYRAGNTALPDLLRALTAATQADAEVQRRKAALGLANARVQQALGVLP